MKSPGAVAFTLWGIDVQMYGILIGIGFAIAIFLAYSRAEKFGIKKDDVLNFTILLIPTSIIGARLYYVLFMWDNYKGSLFDIINIRSGGLAIHGGLLAGILVAAIYTYIRKINILRLGDLVMPGVAIAQAIGRWGNFFNSEAHGGPTDFPIAVIIDGQRMHATFLYESIFCLIMGLWLLYKSKGGIYKFNGQILSLYPIGYSFERFFVEGLRMDSLMIGSFRVAQLVSIIAFTVGIVLYFYLRNKNKASRLSNN